MSKIKCGILGATGMVGQQFILLLDKHVYFELAVLGASEKSAGLTYQEATNWRQTVSCPASVKHIRIKKCTPEEFKDCDLIFSSLDTNIAGNIEEDFLKADFKICSNSSYFRLNPAVPLLIPGVNPKHMDLISLGLQGQRLGLERGFCITNANCSTTGFCVALKPLMENFGLEKVQVVTLQSVSGAGYPGQPSLDVLDNVVPWISGEEDKLQNEPLKIMAPISGNGEITKLDNLAISATCTRVAVTEGHLLCISVKFPANISKPTLKQVREAFTEYVPEGLMDLPSAPERYIEYCEQVDRPQPRLDRQRGRGYTVSVGRIRPCEVLDVKFVALVHNTVLGAAGSAILNAELAYQKGLFSIK